MNYEESQEFEMELRKLCRKHDIAVSVEREDMVTDIQAPGANRRNMISGISMRATLQAFVSRP